MEPRDTPHAPRTSRLVSGCSPKAAGSIRIPMIPPRTPTPIIQLPVCDDIFGKIIVLAQAVGTEVDLVNLAMDDGQVAMTDIATAAHPAPGVF